MTDSHKQKILVASVAVSATTFHFDRLFDYYIPAHLAKVALPGCRVIVPFGGSNKKQQGIIVNTIMSYVEYELKPLASVLDDTPILNEELLLMGQYISEQYFCTLYTAFKSLLPVGIGLKIKELYLINNAFNPLDLKDDSLQKNIYDTILLSKNLLSIEQISITLGVDQKRLKPAIRDLINLHAILVDESISQNAGISTAKMAQINLGYNLEGVALNAKQKLVYNFLNENNSSSYKEIMYYTGITKTVIDTMVKKGYLVSYDAQMFRDAYKHLEKTKNNTELILSKQQENAYNFLLNEYKLNKATTNLLYGVTGSGKTAIYILLIKDIIKDNKTAIVLLPEIALTHQSLKLFYENFGDEVAVLHSGLSIGQRMDEWNRINQGKVSVVVGTRSAIFAPIKNIGIIVIDEEQESSYKSDKTPKYHAKTLAKLRSSYHKCPLVLVSATPSIDAYSRADMGLYNLIKLSKRHNEGDLPDVTLVDMKLEQVAENYNIFSTKLVDALNDNIKNNHQSILLINRRGYNTHVACSGCHQVVMCDNCTIPMTYHTENNKLMCHYCSASKPIEYKCTNCGNDAIRMWGSGTQKIEEHLELTIPSARIMRIDTDIVNNKLILEQKIDDFLQNKYDIMIGTQMIAKGFNFPNVTLVGVINADNSLYSNDYRSFERTFALLTQVVGRAGRHEHEGSAIIQTYSSEVDIFSQIRTQDYEQFYKSEIKSRKQMAYPPFCDMCQVVVSGANEQMVADIAKEFYDILINFAANEFSKVKLMLYHYTPAQVTKVSGKFRYKILMKCRNNAEFRLLMVKTYRAINAKHLVHNQISIDVNPEEIL